MTSGELVDATRLSAWLDAHGWEQGRPMTVQRLPGGTSNEMFIVDRGSSRSVLRRPAGVALQRANEGMRREYRILAALEGTAVPHPAALALCEDTDVLGAAFYLMEHIEGVHPVPIPPALDDDASRAQVSFSMIEALAALHEVDWQRAGIADLGHPDQFHERQAARWSRQLASYEGRELPGFQRVADWLAQNRPVGFVPGLMHGDYHMRNALVAPDAPGRVVAILDWETATIGDPLLDVAGFCEVWCAGTGEGWPTKAALMEHYAKSRRLESVPDLRYYEVLYNFRLAVLVEGIYQRSLRDLTRPVQENSGRRAIVNITRAGELAGV